MKISQVRFEHIFVEHELTRTKRPVAFRDRLRSSIEATGLAEPLKVAKKSDNHYVVLDGVMRLEVITLIRSDNPASFISVPVYVFDYEHRYEIRFQSDIYQDLMPSQLATLVEHLHQTDGVSKTDIGRYIGVSAPTIRNYTGLWRLIQRGGLFEATVNLMDVGILPSSNPYAWLRLSEVGIRFVFENSITNGIHAEDWIESQISNPRGSRSFTLRQVEELTSGLAGDCYRGDRLLRSKKQKIGLMRNGQDGVGVSTDTLRVLGNLDIVVSKTRNEIVRQASCSLRKYLSS
jgi:hypothetical protein